MDLLVLLLNTGYPDNDISVFGKGAFNKIRLYQNIEDDLEVLFLVPVLPRSAKHGLVYIRPFDRDNLLIVIQGIL